MGKKCNLSLKIIKEKKDGAINHEKTLASFYNLIYGKFSTIGN